MTQLAPYALEEATSVDGLTVPLQVFHARWSGNPETVDLREGVLLRWFTPDMLERLNLSPGLGDLIRRHAAEHPPAGSPPPPTRLLCNDAPQATELHIVGVHLYLEDTHGRILLGLRHPDSAYAGNTARSPVPMWTSTGSPGRRTLLLYLGPVEVPFDDTRSSRPGSVRRSRRRGRG